MNRSLLVAVAMLLAVPSAALAHGIGVEAKLKGDTVRVEAFFDDDTSAADAKVVVTTDDGKVVAEGKTDAKGNWSFPVPTSGKYRVTVDAGGGHLAKTTITIPANPAQLPTPPVSGTGILAEPADPSEAIVSDGPTRQETTGPRRWIMAGVGIVLIGLLTWGARLVVRRMSQRQFTEATR